MFLLTERPTGSMGAIERVVSTGKVRTPDLGGTAKTEDLTRAIVSEL